MIINHAFLLDQGHIARSKLQINIFKLDSWSPWAGFFPLATINLFSLKRLRNSDIKINFVIMKRYTCALKRFIKFNMSNTYFHLRFIFNTRNEYQIRTFETGVCVQNHLLNLCSSVINLQRLFCSQKAGVKCPIKAFWYTRNIISKYR